MTDMRSTSRREFLAASALGLAGVHRLVDTGPMREEPADEQLLYVGTYTEAGRSDGIHLVRMDRRTGALRHAGAVDAGPSPSFLALHDQARVLYAVNELTEYEGQPSGAVSAFAVDPGTGALSLVNRQSSRGGAPCFVSIDPTGRLVLVANYVGGNVAVFPIRAGGALEVASHVVQHEGRGPNEARQKGPHAHCIRPDVTGRFALVADLGIDRVLVYRMDPAAGSLRHVEGADASMRPGAGPRHLAFHPALPIVYVANELDSTVATLRFDRESGVLTPIDARATLPRGWSGTNYPADIHVGPEGRTVYVSNRGHNSIAVFGVADFTGALSFRQVIGTDGDWPRNFGIDPTGRWLLVANQRSGTIVVLARDPESGELTSTGHRISVPSPACVRFR